MRNMSRKWFCLLAVGSALAFSAGTVTAASAAPSGVGRKASLGQDGILPAGTATIRTMSMTTRRRTTMARRLVHTGMRHRRHHTSTHPFMNGCRRRDRRTAVSIDIGTATIAPTLDTIRRTWALGGDGSGKRSCNFFEN